MPEESIRGPLAGIEPCAARGRHAAGRLDTSERSELTLCAAGSRIPSDIVDAPRSFQ